MKGHSAALATSGLRYRPAAPKTLDFARLQRLSGAVAVFGVLIAPFSPDPLAAVAGGLVPWIVLHLVTGPSFPAIVPFYLLWQWLQVYGRVFVGMVEGERMSSSIYGPWVADAYWYMLASVVVLALAFRFVLASGPVPPDTERAHLTWRPFDLFLVYLAALGFSMAAGHAIGVLPAIYQQINAVAQFKLAALFLLFAVVLTTRRGIPFLVIAIAIEVVVGFSGLLSDFKAPFIVLALAALAARISWSGTASIVAGMLAALLLVMSLFWTSIKQDYRGVATAGVETQALQIPIGERIGYVARQALAIGQTDWAKASHALLHRLAYVDIFGSVIAVDKEARQQTFMQQWNEAFQHVFQPRFLFPNKAQLSDIDVYLRLTRGDASDAIRSTTSISVGYIAENYVDFGVPAMFAGVFVLGLLLAAVVRYVMSAPLPWMVREATAAAILYTVGGTGVELSLPKILGTAVMFLIVYALLIKFAYPVGLRWLDERATRRQGRVASR